MKLENVYAAELCCTSFQLICGKLYCQCQWFLKKSIQEKLHHWKWNRPDKDLSHYQLQQQISTSHGALPETARNFRESRSNRHCNISCSSKVLTGNGLWRNVMSLAPMGTESCRQLVKSLVLLAGNHPLMWEFLKLHADAWGSARSKWAFVPQGSCVRKKKSTTKMFVEVKCVVEELTMLCCLKLRSSVYFVKLC